MTSKERDRYRKRMLSSSWDLFFAELDYLKDYLSKIRREKSNLKIKRREYKKELIDINEKVNILIDIRPNRIKQ